MALHSRLVEDTEQAFIEVMMSPDPDAAVVLHYAPRTRSLTALWALEEVGVPYRLNAFTVQSGHQRTAEHLALNPMGKVPAVQDRVGGELVSCAETGAILLWLGDRHAGADLAPPAHDPARAAYLRWMFFAGSVIEPSLGEVFFNWKAPSASVAWGSFERMTQAIEGALAEGPWLLGDRFTLADVAVGGGCRFGVLFGAIPKTGPIAEYVARCSARPAFERAAAIEDEHVQRLMGGS